MGLHQNYNLFVLQKTPSRKQKDNPQNEEIFSNHVPDKGFVYQIYKELL